MPIYFISETGKSCVCCCEQLVSTFLAENQGKVSLEAINAFKLSLLQQGAADFPGISEGTENRGLGGYKSMSMRRGSEATQMRIWSQRIAQVPISEIRLFDYDHEFTG